MIYKHYYICNIYIYIYICIHILSSSRKRPDVYCFNGFHRRESRGPVAAGNHKKKTTTETINNVPCHNGNHKKTNDGNHKQCFPATTETIKTSDGNQSQKPPKRGITRYVLKL